MNHVQYQDLIIQETNSILHAIKLMDSLDKKLLIIFSQDKFSGLLSIGDIQRAILKGISLESEVKTIQRSRITVCRSSDSMDEVKEVMFKNRTEFMPLLDDKDQIGSVIFWEDVFDKNPAPANVKLNLPVVIMAGGKGTRLQPITNIIPKALIPIGSKPMIEIIIDRFAAMGVTEFHVSVNYKASMIKDYFDQIPDTAYHLSYFSEEKPLGTAGSISLLKDVITDTFFVSNCDILIDEDYTEIYKYHKENLNELTIVAAIKNYSIPYGTVEFENGGILQSLKEKPTMSFFVNAGMYLLEPQLIKEIPEGEFFHITDLIAQIKSRGGKIGVFPVSEGAWKDIGEWDEYLKNTVYK